MTNQIETIAEYVIDAIETSFGSTNMDDAIIETLEYLEISDITDDEIEEVEDLVNNHFFQ